jgi:hypothetical protein
MKRKCRFMAMLVALNTLGAPMIAGAHHSSAMFDQHSSITLSGVVSKFQWANPHVVVAVEGPNKDGEPTRYIFECSSPNLLGHKGWKVNTLKAGDTVTVIYHPLRNGKPGGLLSTIELPSGIVMNGW